MSNKVKEIILFAVVIVSVLTLVIISMINTKEDNAQMIVAVHVKGEVVNPGYYELDYGSRVKDAIECAGGTTENADTNSLNLAQKLVDGQEVVVEHIVEATESSEQEASGKININKANFSGLCSLPGIGEELAVSIVEYRAKHGNFKNIDALKNVPGIGDSKFEKIKDHITV